MVMAGNESTPATLADDALSARLQWLRQRREALQEKLAQKNNELKNLCVEEAEITGILPPEIPLEPGESPPTFRRKIGSTFIYPSKVTNKLKATDTEESELELERQVQLGIVEAALEVVNDPTESKATRRKHRLAYQQGQRRLQELDTELNFIRQSRGKAHRQTTQLPAGSQGSYNTQPHSHVNVKHRTKKPRPPLDSTTGNEVPAAKSAGRSILHETGISLSPLGPEDKCVAYPGHGYEEQLAVPNLCSVHHHSGTYPGVSPIEQANIKIVEHDHNDNQNVYILPDQYRARTYSHGSGSSRGHRDHYQDAERTYRPYVPNTYTEDERQMRYRQFQQQQYFQKQQQQQQPHDHMIPSYRLQYGTVEHKHLDNADIIRRSSQVSYDRDFRVSHYVPITDYHQVYYKNSAQPHVVQRRGADSSSSSSSGKTTLRHTGTGAPMIDAQLPAGYWMRQDDEIVWVSMDEPADRFGSLDRRRRNAQHNGGVGAHPDAQSRYRTVAVAGTKTSAAGNASASSSSHQHHSVHLLPLSEQQIPANNKMLLRTQSLGSVETWQSSHSHDSHDGKDIAATEYTSRKSRQKEWYETSLDSGVSVGLDQNLIAARKNTHYQSSPPLARVKAVGNEGGAKEEQMMTGPPMSPVNRQKRDKQLEERQHMMQQQPHTRYEQPATRPKVLEIPAESKPSHDVCDDAVRPPLGSPQNCTVVQAGKYQPYREVTKPFEMSDFYKYSTKYRKRNEAAGQQQLGNDSPLQENRPVVAEGALGSGDLSKDAYSYGQNGSASVTASPVQRKIYQPVQRMTCQPYLTSLR